MAACPASCWPAPWTCCRARRQRTRTQSASCCACRWAAVGLQPAGIKYGACSPPSRTLTHHHATTHHTSLNPVTGGVVRPAQAQALSAASDQEGSKRCCCCCCQPPQGRSRRRRSGSVGWPCDRLSGAGRRRGAAGAEAGRGRRPRGAAGDRCVGVCVCWDTVSGVGEGGGQSCLGLCTATRPAAVQATRHLHTTTDHNQQAWTATARCWHTCLQRTCQTTLGELRR